MTVPEGRSASPGLWPPSTTRLSSAGPRRLLVEQPSRLPKTKKGKALLMEGPVKQLALDSRAANASGRTRSSPCLPPTTGTSRTWRRLPLPRTSVRNGGRWWGSPGQLAQVCLLRAQEVALHAGPIPLLLVKRWPGCYCMKQCISSFPSPDWVFHLQTGAAVAHPALDPSPLWGL